MPVCAAYSAACVAYGPHIVTGCGLGARSNVKKLLWSPDGPLSRTFGPAAAAAAEPRRWALVLVMRDGWKVRRRLKPRARAWCHRVWRVCPRGCRQPSSQRTSFAPEAQQSSPTNLSTNVDDPRASPRAGGRRARTHAQSTDTNTRKHKHARAHALKYTHAHPHLLFATRDVKHEAVIVIGSIVPAASARHQDAAARASVSVSDRFSHAHCAA